MLSLQAQRRVLGVWVVPYQDLQSRCGVGTQALVSVNCVQQAGQRASSSKTVPNNSLCMRHPSAVCYLSVVGA